MADFPDSDDEATSMDMSDQMDNFGSDTSFGDTEQSFADTLSNLDGSNGNAGSKKATSSEMSLDDTFDTGIDMWENSHNTGENLSLIRDIPANLVVEFGRTKIAIRHLLQLIQGSLIELDGLAGEPMDILVNGCLIAKGEIVVVDEKFGLRLTEIISPSERFRQLNR